MGGVITLPTITIVANWVTKDLLFIIGGPALTGPLSSYAFHMIVENNGHTVYEDPLDPPDAYGRIIARGKDLNPRGGTLIVSGLYQGFVDLSQGIINPLISGRVVYSTRVHGRMLTFNVNPVIGQVGSITATDANATTESDATVGGTVTGTYAPLGIGGSVSGTVTQPGDSRTRTGTTGGTRNINSVSGLEVTQVGAPAGRR